MYFNKKQLIIIFAFTLASSALAESEPLSCSQVQGCGDCLANGCSWMGGGICTESCDTMADATCYSKETFPTDTNFEICQMAASDEEDLELCRAQEGCSACVATIKSDGTSCKYYMDETGFTEAGGYCGTGGCNMVGCPLETCPTENPLEDVELIAGNDDDVNVDVDDSLDNGNVIMDDDGASDDISTVPAISNSIPGTPMQRSWPISKCIGYTSCQSCLARNSGCAWTAGECRDSCDWPDNTCYQVSKFRTAAEVCQVEALEKRNHARCGRESNCQDCNSRSTLDAKGRPSGSTCVWYSTGAKSGFCGSLDCDGWMFCGGERTFTCPSKPGLRGIN